MRHEHSCINTSHILPRECLIYLSVIAQYVIYYLLGSINIYSKLIRDNEKYSYWRAMAYMWEWSTKGMQTMALVSWKIEDQTPTIKSPNSMLIFILGASKTLENYLNRTFHGIQTNPRLHLTLFFQKSLAQLIISRRSLLQKKKEKKRSLHWWLEP